MVAAAMRRRPDHTKAHPLRDDNWIPYARTQQTEENVLARYVRPLARATRSADAAGLDDSLHSLGLDGSGHSSGSGHSFGLDHSGHSLGLSGLAPDAMDASIHAPRHFLFADLAAGGEADDEPPSI